MKWMGNHLFRDFEEITDIPLYDVLDFIKGLGWLKDRDCGLVYSFFFLIISDKRKEFGVDPYKRSPIGGATLLHHPLQPNQI